MNKSHKIYIFIFIIFLFLFAMLWSQDDLSQSSNLGTVISIEDSTKAITNTLDELTYEEVIDSLNTIINKKKNNQIYLINNSLLYSENFHLNSLEDPHISLKIGKFNLRSFKVKNVQILQNFAPHFRLEELGHKIDFQPEHYSLRAPLTIANLALGDYNMNHAGVKFLKGRLFNIDNLNFDFSYLGHDGEWLGVQEKGYSFSSHFWYTLGNHQLDFQMLSYRQDTSNRKLKDFAETPPQIIEETYISPSMFWYNPYLNIGLRHESWDVDKSERVEDQFVINKEFSISNLSTEFTIEYFKQKIDNSTSNNFSTSADVNYKFRQFNLDGNVYFVDDNDYFVNIQSHLHQSFGPIFEYYAVYDSTDFSEISAGLKLGKGLNYWKMFYSIPEKHPLDYYLKSDLYWSIPIDNFEIALDSWIKFFPKGDFNDDSKISEIPQLQSNNKLELLLNLPYGNHIKSGIHHYYHSEIRKNSITYNSSILDLFLAIGITSKFEIIGEMKNLTNSSYLFNDQDILISGTHFNVKLIWFFLN